MKKRPNPFKYPQSIHRRTENPPGYSRYQSFKPTLKREFKSQCVYCRLPDAAPGYSNFGVDHYRPVKKFPDLATSYGNLFYACNACNRRKSDFWPNRNELKSDKFIPNPCLHIMFSHLRYESAKVVAKSSAGIVAEKILLLNDEYSVQYRQNLLIAAQEVSKNAEELRTTIRDIQNLQKAAPHNQELEKEKNNLFQKLQRLETYLVAMCC